MWFLISCIALVFAAVFGVGYLGPTSLKIIVGCSLLFCLVCMLFATNERSWAGYEGVHAATTVVFLLLLFTLAGGHDLARA